MSKPNFTTHVVRSVVRELSQRRINVGHRNKIEIPFPSIESNPNFAKEYMLYNLTRKYEPPMGSYDPTESIRKSLTKWVDSEWTCQVVNRHGKYASPIYDNKDVISRLQRLTTMHVSRILCDRWPDISKFEMTGGATNLAKRKYCHPAAKLSGTPDPFNGAPHNLACVKGASELLVDILEGQPLVLKHLKERYVADKKVETNQTSVIVDWLTEVNTPAKLDYVAKDDESVRLIAKSGSASSAVQKIFGTVIRKALLAEGIDLSSQTVNQEWAEIGSLTGIVATVDLSSASDNISLNMLKYFPVRWQEYVLASRDTHVTVDGGVEHKLEKIAGMGNGFIFELETLLFYAMCLAVCEELKLDTSMVTVYGDDIIIPSRGSDLLEFFFTINGFTYNPDKSFAGPEGFRESCGKHYYNGVDVTPFYIRGDAVTKGDKYHLFNGLTAWVHQTGENLDGSLALVVNSIEKFDRRMVPLTWSSRSGLHYPCAGASAPEHVWCKHLQRYITRYKPLCEVAVDRTDRYPEIAVYMACLLALEAREVVFDFRTLGVSSILRQGYTELVIDSTTRPNLTEMVKHEVKVGDEVYERHVERVCSTWI